MKESTKASNGTRTIRLAKPPVGFPEVQEALRQIVDSGRLIEGSNIEEFEKNLAEATCTKYCSAVSSGTAALHLIFMAAGIKKGDEVIIPDYTFFSPANMVEACGAKTVPTDIRLDTLNMDPTDFERKITEKTRAVLAIHQFGNPSEMGEIMKIAEEKDIDVFEDSACSLGAMYEGKPLGGIGKAAALSFHPRKIISTGEGGAVVTNDSEIAEAVAQIRNHGITKIAEKKVMTELGFNYRMPEMSAALGNAQIKKLPEIIRKRKELAGAYKDGLEGIGLTLPNCEGHIYQSYVILVNKRDEMVEFLRNSGIEAVKGAETIHMQPYYQKKYGFKPGDLPKSYEAYQKAVTLPLHSEMSNDDVAFVSEKIKDFLRK